MPIVLLCEAENCVQQNPAHTGVGDITAFVLLAELCERAEVHAVADKAVCDVCIAVSDAR